MGKPSEFLEETYTTKTRGIGESCIIITSTVFEWSTCVTDKRTGDSIYRALHICCPIQYEHAPLQVLCAMLREHPPVDPVLSCLSCFRKPSVGVCQVVSNSPDSGIAWPYGVREVSSRPLTVVWRGYG